jgi:ABC-type uncharacterized transport system auxiliary subunit
MIRFVPPLLLAVVLGGCFGSVPPVPRDHYYRILVPPPAAEAGAPGLPGVVSVPAFEASGLLRERPLVLSRGEPALELQQHDYHHWTDPPPRMLQDQMVSYLRRAGLAGSVVTPSARIRPDYEVVGRIKRLERLLGGRANRVSAELELALVGVDDGRQIVMKSYVAERSTPEGSVAGSIAALNQAVAEIFDRFLADARSTTLAERSLPR